MSERKSQLRVKGHKLIHQGKHAWCECGEPSHEGQWTGGYLGFTKRHLEHKQAVLRQRKLEVNENA